MPLWLTISLGLLAATGAAVLLWKGLKRAEETDQPLERLLIRVGLSVLLVGGLGWVVFRVLGSGGGGGSLGAFGLAFIVGGSMGVAGLVLGIIWAPEFGSLIARPFVGLFLGSDEGPEAQPIYSFALARRKRGKYAEAIAEVRTQLEKFPDDVQGWFLLADIQMDDLHDFDQAAATIQAFIARPGPSPQHIILGWSRLAEWHLKYRHDYEAARRILEAIVQQFPDVPQARAAYQRLAHMDEMQQFSASHGGSLPAGPKADPHLGLRPRQNPEAAPVDGGAGKLEQLLLHLEKFPLDREAREQVALSYAHDQHRPDLCAEQMEYLIGLPDARPAEIVRWLNLLADVYIKEAHDAGAARQALERLLEVLPNSPVAEQTRRRMELLEREVRGAAQSQDVKLGTYEQNLGLKDDVVPPWWKRAKRGPSRDL